tara:strand:- start:957 stop:1325 length:369 start_codon:yes stop_codon:yes gene_type:complete
MALIVGGTTVTGTQTLQASTLTGTASAINGSNITNLPAPSSANVGTALAGIGQNDVGGTILGKNGTGSTQQPGSTQAASGMDYASAGGQEPTGNVGSGTYKVMGYCLGGGDTGQTTVFKRIS